LNEYLRRGPRSLWRQARSVRAPTLVVYGSADPMVDARLAGRAARAFAGSTVLVLSGVGHVAQLEAPDTVATAIRALLDRTG
jgi:pimeloyl-ACP methyl ester carboxylesterase